MQCYSELVPPSGVTDALALPFTSADARNLIVARTSLLQVYTYKQVNNGHDTKLVLVDEFSLSGTISSLARVSVSSSKSGGDAVLVALRDAKLSLIEWDPLQHSISTVSIHYYEQHDLSRSPWLPDLKDCPSHLTVDPSSRCAAFNFGVSNLAIIPFRQSGDDLNMDDIDDIEEEKPITTQREGDDGHTNGHPAPYLPSFVLPLTVLDPGLLHPIDIAFLHEYREPTIGILYSTAARSANMAFDRKDVTMYAVYTLDLEQKASTTLQSIQKLPNDLYKVMALPAPVGGSLLIGDNELVHVDQGGKTNAIGVNEFAKEASGFPMGDHSEYRMRLEGCQLAQLASTSGDMLLILASGEVATLSFRLDGRSVSGLSLQRLDSDNISSIFKGRVSATAHLGLGRLFIASEELDSLLISTTKKTAQLKKQGSRAPQQSNGTGEQDGDDDYMDEDEDEDDLYADLNINGTSITNAILGSNFRVLDRLPVIASLRDVTFGKAVKRKREDEDDQPKLPGRLDLVAACGQGRGGSLAFFSRELEPRITKRIKQDNVNGVWSFTAQKKAGTTKAGTNPSYHDHVILSHLSPNGTFECTLWASKDGSLHPKEGTDFDTSIGPTIAVGRIDSHGLTVQVSPTEIRIYNSGMSTRFAF